MDIDLKIPARPGGEVKIPANERKPIPQNEQPVQPLKKRDSLSEWSDYKKTEKGETRCRLVVGSKISFWNSSDFKNNVCPFCKTGGHWVCKEYQHRRIGRDNKERVYSETKESVDIICPKCGYRW